MLNELSRLLVDPWDVGCYLPVDCVIISVGFFPDEKLRRLFKHADE